MALIKHLLVRRRLVGYAGVLRIPPLGELTVDRTISRIDSAAGGPYVALDFSGGRLMVTEHDGAALSVHRSGAWRGPSASPTRINVGETFRVGGLQMTLVRINPRYQSLEASNPHLLVEAYVQPTVVAWRGLKKSLSQLQYVCNESARSGEALDDAHRLRGEIVERLKVFEMFVEQTIRWRDPSIRALWPAKIEELREATERLLRNPALSTDEAESCEREQKP
ncbi:MAG TPA: hypothetical protein QGF58_23415 [Myxococcota bacterium]|nr:hypothetical protein [Myxococcota bacterium]